jgi:hypothetical protein
MGNPINRRRIYANRVVNRVFQRRCVKFLFGLMYRRWSEVFRGGL